MTVQIIEIAGQKLAMLPIADYERLVDLAEDRSDVAAAEAAEQRRISGEEYLPAELVDQMMAGENALKTWRKFRNMTQEELAQAVGRKKAYISKLETGRSEGGVDLWRSLADALDVTVDDILPSD